DPEPPVRGAVAIVIDDDAVRDPLLRGSQERGEGPEVDGDPYTAAPQLPDVDPRMGSRPGVAQGIRDHLARFILERHDDRVAGGLSANRRGPVLLQTRLGPQERCGRGAWTGRWTSRRIALTGADRGRQRWSAD